MAVIESINQVPIPYEPARGTALSADWAATGALAELLKGIGGCSPYLNDVLRQEQAWICEAVHADAPLEGILPSDLGADPGQILRQSKRRMAGFLAMVELSGAYPLNRTTQALTDFADAAVQAAFTSALAPYQASGKLPEDTGLFVVAMGKMGAGELNYSSDIDLIVMFDDRNMDHLEASHLRQILVRATRTATKLLNDVTQHGYVFRTDLRLRPDPSVTPICVSMSSALEYYESLGRTWERAAFISQTLAALDQLVAKEWVTSAINNQLQRSYTVLRHTEHAIQMIRDAQTQSVPQSEEGLARVAGLCGQTSEAFLNDISAHLNAVHSITETFFAPAQRTVPEVALEGHHDITQHWPSYAAMRSERATVLFDTLRPEILARLQNAPDPKEALIQFDNFLQGLPAGIQVFSLFAANPKLVDLLTDIAVSAPALAQYLGRNSGVLDAVLSGEFFAAWPDQEALQLQLSTTLARAFDYETGLDLARIWTKEWHFRIGVHVLQEIITPKAASEQYAQLAQTVLVVVFAFVHREFARKYGDIAQSDSTILAMGSLGAGQLNSDSDLDLILIFDADPNALSDGHKTLACRQYFSRLTQALITALTAPTAYGRLYEVDMRLRPSGRSGPVATSITGFETYQRNEAWTWEHLALTRGRAITGSVEFRKKVEDLRQRILDEKSDWAKVMSGVSDMRVRLAESKPQQGLWDIKRGPGGLQDIELLGQGIALVHHCREVATAAQLHSGQSAAHLKVGALDELARSHDWLSDLRLLHRLMCGTDTQDAAVGEGGRARLFRIAQIDQDLDFEHIVLTKRAHCVQIIDGILGQIEGQGYES